MVRYYLTDLGLDIPILNPYAIQIANETINIKRFKWGLSKYDSYIEIRVNLSQYFVILEKECKWVFNLEVKIDYLDSLLLPEINKYIIAEYLKPIGYCSKCGDIINFIKDIYENSIGNIACINCHLIERDSFKDYFIKRVPLKQRRRKDIFKYDSNGNLLNMDGAMRMLLYRKRKVKRVLISTLLT